MRSNSGTALITGVCGQDGWYLAEHLLRAGYQVVGTTHRSEAPTRIEVLGASILVHHLDLTSAEAVRALLKQTNPGLVFNLAARASSAQLFDDPLATTDVNGVAVVRLLEAIRGLSPEIRFCQASSSEVFAGAEVSPQSERTPPRPRNAYGCAKAFGDHMIAAYRQAYGLFACSAILFPHESPRRSKHFLVRKVTSTAAAIAIGKGSALEIGDLSASRDWGYAPDHMAGMLLMLQQSTPRDFVLATGESHTVAEVCQLAFSLVGLKWSDFVRTNPSFVRPADSIPKVGDASLARSILGWKPSLGFSEMIALLVNAETIAINEGNSKG